MAEVNLKGTAHTVGGFSFIKIKCPHCREKISANKDQRVVRCPSCGTVLAIPQAQGGAI